MVTIVTMCGIGAIRQESNHRGKLLYNIIVTEVSH